jgi:hypothetical protein
MFTHLSDAQSSDGNDPENVRQLHSFLGPQQVDSQIRQAINTFWMILPTDRKTVDGVEEEVRRVVDRALRDLREDYESIGLLTK